MYGARNGILYADIRRDGILIRLSWRDFPDMECLTSLSACIHYGKIKTRAGRGDTRAFLFHVTRVVGQSYVRQQIAGTI